MASGIYAITNLVTLQRYIGQARRLSHRRRTHFRHLRKGKHGNKKLQASFNEFGELAFQWRILRYTPIGLDEVAALNWLNLHECKAIDSSSYKLFNTAKPPQRQYSSEYLQPVDREVSVRLHCFEREDGKEILSGLLLDVPDIERSTSAVSAVHLCLSLLSPRHQVALEGYYGLGHEPPRTKEHLGLKLGVSRQRASKIIDNALEAFIVTYERMTRNG